VVTGYDGCACSTTADFSAAAIKQVTLQGHIGTYAFISTTHASSAYMYATPGKWVGSGSERNYFPPTATPIDSNGNSLAGDSESAQQAFYGALDTNLMMVNRSDPLVTNTIGNQIPSFLGHDDYAISAAYFNDSTTDASSLNNGATVTITWVSSGTVIVAVYQVVWLGDDHTDVNNFALDWKSATQNGTPINRAGTPLGQSSGGTGSSSGSVLVYGFGSGAGWTFAGAGDPSTPGVTITVGDPIEDVPITTDTPVPDDGGD